MDGNNTDDPHLARRSYLSGGAATLGLLSLGAGSVAAGTDDTRTDQEGVEQTNAQTNPARELAIQPGTSVLFEVESDALGEYGGGTRWFVDGEPEGHSLGPWYSAYHSHQGAECWHYSFESEGIYEVTAIVDSGDKDYRAAWTVSVTPDGTTAPTIEETQPADESLEIGRDEETELELTVADSDGNLDRVVWWLGHADVILGVTDVSGSEDTASLTLERECDGCPIIAWVISEDRTITTESIWMIDKTIE